jgi:hypothetical protein
MPYAINITGWRAVGTEFTEADLAPGETLVDEIPQSLLDAIAAQEALREVTADLNARTRLANAQVTALQGRVDAINDAIEGDYALPEEVAELPSRVTLLAAWKKYRVLLGRVSAEATWPAAPVWPAEPDPYTSETAFIYVSPALS